MIFGQKDELAEKMVKSQLKTRDIYDARVCDVMERVPRHLFISGVSRQKAYGDYPLSIGFGQTISQPYMAALMTEQLQIRPESRILEIGTGSGYQTAILAELGKEVYTIERISQLLKHARLLLENIGFRNIHYKESDGTLGWQDQAPFDRIIVTAAAPGLPMELAGQLADNGIMVVPVGDYRASQILKIVTRTGSVFDVDESIGCRFVPLIGEHGFTGME